jgi:hypothetical protein
LPPCDARRRNPVSLASVGAAGVALGTVIELSCPLLRLDELMSVVRYVGDGSDVAINVTVRHFASDDASALTIPFAGVPGDDILAVTSMPIPSPPPSPPSPPPLCASDCSKAISSGVTLMCGSGGSTFSVYCDITSAGGPWALVEVGTAQGTNLRTESAVGGTPLPIGSSSSAKLSRAQMLTMWASKSSSAASLKWGAPGDYLFARCFMVVPWAHCTRR